MPATIQTLRSGATAHPEEIVNFLSARFVEVGGVFDKSGGHFLCEEQAVPDMTVLVNQGYAFIPKTDGSMAYPVRLYDGDYSATITSNASGNPRIDAIVLYIDLAASANSGATNVAKVSVVAGTPAASPSAPTDFAIGSAIGASNPFVRLAHVTVASGASSIENADIDDQRQQVRASQKLDFAKTGDVKMSVRATADEGWLLMNDETIGDVGSGADHEGAHFEDLFNLLDTDFGQTPTAAWASGGTIVVPKMNGKAPVGYDSGDSDYNALGKIGGAKTKTISQANLPNINFTVTDPGHNHTQNAHGHGVTDPGHYHTFDISFGDQDGSGSNGAINGGARNTSSVGTGISIQNATATNNAATTGISVSSGGSGTALDVKTPYRVFNFMIKW